MFLNKICHVKIWQNEKSAITCALQNTLVETIATGLIILSDYLLLNLLYFSLVWVKVLFITKNVFCFILIFASDNCCEGSIAKNLSVNIFHASLLKWISNKQQNLENLWQDCFLFLSFHLRESFSSCIEIVERQNFLRIDKNIIFIILLIGRVLHFVLQVDKYKTEK